MSQLFESGGQSIGRMSGRAFQVKGSACAKAQRHEPDLGTRKCVTQLECTGHRKESVLKVMLKCIFSVLFQINQRPVFKGIWEESREELTL